MRNTALLLALLAGPALAQPQKPPAEEHPAAAASGAPRLNLKLENPGQYAREEPTQEAAGAQAAGHGLPMLGGNAMPIERRPTRHESATPSTPFPKDTEQDR